MDTLNENQTKIALSCLYNVQDKLQAIEKELATTDKPHKTYLNEKLDSIYWDVNTLRNICKKEELQN